MEAQMRVALEKLEAQLRTEAATELSQQTLAASAKLRETVDIERRQARSEFDAAMRIADAKHKDLEARTLELETKCVNGNCIAFRFIPVFECLLNLDFNQTRRII